MKRLQLSLIVFFLFVIAIGNVNNMKISQKGKKKNEKEKMFLNATNTTNGTNFDVDLNISINLKVKDELTNENKINTLHGIRDYLLLKDRYFKEKIKDLLKLNQNLTKNNSDLFMLLNQTKSQYTSIVNEINALKKEQEVASIQGKDDIIQMTKSIITQLTEFNTTNSMLERIEDSQQSIIQFMKTKIEDLEQKEKVLTSIQNEINNVFYPKIKLLIEGMKEINHTQSIINNIINKENIVLIKYNESYVCHSTVNTM